MTTPFDIQTVTLIVTVIVAFSGYLITHRSELARARRAERLELIDRRINEFYGPLYIVLQDSRISYRTLLDKYDKTSSFLERGKQATEQESNDWRLWMVNVFMPLNLHVENLILENAYLIREEKMPECLIRFLTHVSVYKTILKKWEVGDYSELISVNDFPRELSEYATRSYQELKQEQLRLIGQI